MLQDKQVQEIGLILVTGATGFVGRALVKELLARKGYAVRAAVRRDGHGVDGLGESVSIGDLSPETDWAQALAGVDIVVHTAARVHIMDDKAINPLTEFCRINVDGTLALARQAAAAGVRRFVFISSVKVNGEETLPGHPFTADAVPAPQDAYGISKRDAELGLQQIAAETGLEVVVIRPPLVYGPGVRANFQTLLCAVGHGLPLPLGAVDNRRSLVALDNLVDFIIICINHPRAANQTFLVSDGEDISTPELIRRMASVMGKHTYLLPVPVWMLKVGATLLGKRDMAQRLCGSLQLDIEKTRRLLGWCRPLSLDQGLKKVAGGGCETDI